MNPPVNFRNLPKLKPKKQKLIAAILMLIEEAAKVGRILTKGEIVKALFIADGTHLEKYGRPVTFDNYVAMKKGPVGDKASDMLNDQVNWAEFDLLRAPWDKREERGLVFYIATRMPAQREKLSPSDEDEVSDALALVLAAGFDEVSLTSHDHPAWQIAWSGKDSTAGAAAMDWRQFPKVDPRTVSDLVAASWHTL